LLAASGENIWPRMGKTNWPLTDTDAKQTLNAAAVVGLRFTVELLAALGTDPDLDTDAVELRGAAVDENAALIAEHLEAAGDLRAAYGWHMRAGAWSQWRDIAAADVSWERAARIADVLPAEDPDLLGMRTAPRTLSCAHGWRIHKPVAGRRFEELQDLCAAAFDKASMVIATIGLVEEHLMVGWPKPPGWSANTWR
jgi:hypothetical protein